MTEMVQKPCPPVRIWEISPPHEYPRNMNITYDMTTMLTCPISELLKANSPVTP